jgi:hypothetical protein
MLGPAPGEFKNADSKGILRCGRVFSSLNKKGLFETTL